MDALLFNNGLIIIFCNEKVTNAVSEAERITFYRDICVASVM